MQTKERLAATIEAPHLLLARLGRVLRDTGAPEARLGIFPLYGILWVSPVVKPIGSRELNHLLDFARKPPHPLRSYDSPHRFYAMRYRGIPNPRLAVQPGCFSRCAPNWVWNSRCEFFLPRFTGWPFKVEWGPSRFRLLASRISKCARLFCRDLT